MNPRRCLTSRGWCVALLPLVVGCARFGTPFSYPTTTAEGVVSIGGKPLPAGSIGWVTFYPDGGTVGDATTARLDANGRYRANLVPIGKLQVRLRFADEVARRLRKSTPLRVDEWGGPGTPLASESRVDRPLRYDIDLLVGGTQRIASD